MAIEFGRHSKPSISGAEKIARSRLAKNFEKLAQGQGKNSLVSGVVDFEVDTDVSTDLITDLKLVRNHFFRNLPCDCEAMQNGRGVTPDVGGLLSFLSPQPKCCQVVSVERHTRQPIGFGANPHAKGRRLDNDFADWPKTRRSRFRTAVNGDAAVDGGSERCPKLGVTISRRAPEVAAELR